jgi:hypothetical protein
MNFSATHSGVLRGDSRTGGAKPRVLLRETEKFWITKQGTKYRKSTGRPTGGDPWPLWTLDTESVVRLP